ncbi:right-handed parallel beta-helix repeat-containing protein [Massilia brevitalea]|uniref:right-handed parallel beta-helix repeat-containing protein n=1 Tax=Massilia brevitalea TaxID=442526 RepID=UPI002738C44F|nr:right-handed parallel beta-helix repeat-containing protein [Massilia brevitalea]
MLVDSHYRPFAHGSEYKNDDHIVILVAGDNLVVDLQRHTVVANAAMRAAIDTPARDWINYPDVHGPVLPANVPLDLRSDIASPGAAAHMAERTTFALEEVRRALPARARDYPARGILVERVAISSAGWGIGVEGAGTVIRNSTIEVDAGTALWIYGPNARIENNTIIVRGRGRVREVDAPIRLHHGDGAIIRNNRIVVKGDGHPWAVTSFRTGAITLEGNTLNGKPLGHEGIKVFADDLFQLTETTGVL